MASNIERIEALERQNAASPEVLEILLELVEILDYHSGHNMKPLKRRIRVLQEQRLQGQQRFQ
jgi:hypothetical protein